MNQTAVWVSSCLAAMLAVGLTGCGGSSDAAPGQGAGGPGDNAPPVKVATPIVRTVVETQEFTGRLEAVEFVELRPRVSGFIEKANFAEGSLVQKGQELFKLDDRTYAAAFQQAKANVERATAVLDNAQVEFDRVQELRTGNAVSNIEYESAVQELRTAQADLAAANAAMESARLNVEFTGVDAPISGRVSDIRVDAGNLVTGGTDSGTMLTTITTVDPIYCYGDVDEQTVLRYRTGRVRKGGPEEPINIPVDLSVSDGQGFRFRGRIDFVDNRVDPNTGTVRVRAVFDNKDGYLTPGFFARLRVPNSEPQEAVLVDTEAIGQNQNQQFLYVVDEKNTVKFRPVELGPTYGKLTVIRNGVKADERVIVSGLLKVRPDAIVNPEQTQMQVDDDTFPDVPGLAESTTQPSTQSSISTQSAN